jgi:hypothetical protein
MGEIDTTKSERRALCFANIDDLLVEVDRLAAADQQGRLRHAGNWTLGQACGHLATWINYAYEGYPMRVPWFIRMVLRRMVKKWMREGMSPGGRIPKVEGGTYGIEPLDTNEGAARLRAALARLVKEPARFHSPAFGQFGEEDRLRLTLRHAELHLGFFHPR